MYAPNPIKCLKHNTPDCFVCRNEFLLSFYDQDYYTSNHPEPFLFPTTVDEVEKFELEYEKLPQSTKDLDLDNLRQFEVSMVLRWMRLSGYLKSELEKGNREFRLSFLGQNQVILHPFGSDGETLDLNL